jgi:exodeoxyribonuclease-3
VIVATWNVASLKARLPRVTQWLEDVKPDVLCLQETKMTDANFPAMAFVELGYEAAHFGQGQWNGVAIISRVGLESVENNFESSGKPDHEARIITADCGGIRISSVYVPNGREVEHDHYKYKLWWLNRLTETLQKNLKGTPTIVAGDFNIAPEDRDVWDIKEFAGATHVSDAERSALDAIKATGLTDVFRDAHPLQDKLYTFWDFRGGDFHKGKGMRIDYLLCSPDVANRVDFTLVDRNARKGESPSDHAPVMIGFKDA